jgi:hypothetical protein
MDAKYRLSAEEKFGISVMSYVHETTTLSKRPMQGRLNSAIAIWSPGFGSWLRQFILANGPLVP